MSRTSVQKAFTLRRVEYQIPGKGRRREVAWIDPALVPDPAAALMDKLGPLAWCSAAEQPVIASAGAQSAAIPGPVSDGAGRIRRGVHPRPRAADQSAVVAQQDAGQPAPRPSTTFPESTNQNSGVTTVAAVTPVPAICDEALQSLDARPGRRASPKNW